MHGGPTLCHAQFSSDDEWRGPEAVDFVTLPAAAVVQQTIGRAADSNRTEEDEGIG